MILLIKVAFLANLLTLHSLSDTNKSVRNDTIDGTFLYEVNANFTAYSVSDYTTKQNGLVYFDTVINKNLYKRGIFFLLINYDKDLKIDTYRKHKISSDYVSVNALMTSLEEVYHLGDSAYYSSLIKSGVVRYKKVKIKMIVHYFGKVRQKIPSFDDPSKRCIYCKIPTYLVIKVLDFKTL